MMQMHVLLRLAEAKSEFDQDTVSPGFEGFIFTAVFAVAVIVLGFFLVSRLRRNAIRSEVLEQIAEELEQQGDGDPAPHAS